MLEHGALAERLIGLALGPSATNRRTGEPVRSRGAKSRSQSLSEPEPVWTQGTERHRIDIGAGRDCGRRCADLAPTRIALQIRFASGLNRTPRRASPPPTPIAVPSARQHAAPSIIPSLPNRMALMPPATLPTCARLWPRSANA
jgi:hypothetical protein